MAASYYNLQEYKKAFVVASMAKQKRLEPNQRFHELQGVAYLRSNQKELKEQGKWDVLR